MSKKHLFSVNTMLLIHRKLATKDMLLWRNIKENNKIIEDFREGK